MELTLTTPSILFPAISLLLLAYTNRFLALAALIRTLHERYQASRDHLLMAQIDNLRYRVHLIRNMQAFGVFSLLLCTLCILILFGGYLAAGKVTFALSLVMMMISLGLSIREIQVSVNALNLQLGDLEEHAV